MQLENLNLERDEVAFHYFTVPFGTSYLIAGHPSLYHSVKMRIKVFVYTISQKA